MNISNNQVKSQEASQNSDFAKMTEEFLNKPESERNAIVKAESDRQLALPVILPIESLEGINI